MSPPLGSSADFPLEIGSRKRRLRSGSLLPASPNPHCVKTQACVRRQPLNQNVRRGFDAASTDVDPQYMLFLEHLRPDGRSYVFEMAIEGSASPLVLKYEAVDSDGFSGVVQSQQSRRSPVSNVNVPRAWGAKKRNEMKASLKSSPVLDPCSSRSAGVLDADCSLVDEDYQIFLNHVKVHGDTMVFQCGSNATVVYEEEGKVEVDVQEIEEEEVEVQEVEEVEREEEIEEVKREEKAIQVVEGDDDDAIETGIEEVRKESNEQKTSVGISDLLQILRHKVSSPFKSRLMHILEKPFDQKEYDDLMALVTARKPIVKFKHLRDESIAYSTNMMGYSYLDHYPGLLRQIESADLPGKLLLLRGFFYWLENLGHEGSFMPWVNASSSFVTVPSGDCRAMVPLHIEMSEG